jgi:Ca2+-binding RTX toxin-like protein
MAATADGNNDGIAGDIVIEAKGTVSEAMVVNAGALTSGQSLRFNPIDEIDFGGSDSVVGGAGDDFLSGSLGNDTLRGGIGNDRLIGNVGLDVLDGGSGNDTIDGGLSGDSIIAGEGQDVVTGGSAGDLINLAEFTSVRDTVRFIDEFHGSGDINGIDPESSTDRIIGFNPSVDKVELLRSGIGLGSGGVVVVAPNGAWNIGTGAVFLFESDSLQSDTLTANNFGSFAEIAFAINSDNGAGFGSSAGRTVALVVSNSELSAARRTGLYVWTDTDGDSVLESGDVVHLLAIFDGVRANQFTADTFLI